MQLKYFLNAAISMATINVKTT